MKVIPSLFFVLCGCKNAGNMGAAARAVKNMGCDGLILVSPNRERWLEGIKMAPGAEDVLEHAPLYTTLDRAVSDMHYVVGTTSRMRRHRLATFEPRQIMDHIMALPPGHRVAIVFGSERNGLSNHELSLCQKVVVIPTSRDLPSINLAQAVMIMAYEWQIASRGRRREMSPGREADRATAGERQGLVEHMERVLRRIGFMQTGERHILITLIDVISMLDLTQREVAMMRGILSLTERHLDGTARTDEIHE
ncbi:MAG: RNA methyltransferase [bacterium]